MGIMNWYSSKAYRAQRAKEKIMSSNISFSNVTGKTKTIKLSTMLEGQTFLRNGAVCMRVKQCHIKDFAGCLRTKVWIVNLQTGSCWAADDDDLVTPLCDVQMTFSEATNRC